MHAVHSCTPLPLPFLIQESLQTSITNAMWGGLAPAALCGLLASWLGTLCWNQASRLLPTSLTGQLIVFETLSALAYGFIHRGAWPEPWTWAGIALLIAGVIAGTRVFAAPRSAGV